jgi:hypothetical protein
MPSVARSRFRAVIAEELALRTSIDIGADADIALISEFLRNEIWAQWKPGTRDAPERGVYFDVLQARACEMIQGIGVGPKESLSLFRQVVRRLVFVGDIEHLDDGGIVPTPLRFLHGPDRYIVIGGQPTRLLSAAIRGRITHVGTGRWCSGMLSESELPVGNCFQALHAWSKRPHQSLDEVLSAHLNQPREHRISSFGTSKVEVYAPYSCQTELGRFSHSHRWKALEEPNKDQMALIKFWNAEVELQYAVAEIHHGKVISISPPIEALDDVRRLQHAIDRDQNIPLYIRRLDATTIKLLGRLPEPEMRLLYVSAFQCSTPEKSNYPQTWQFFDDNTLRLWESTIADLGVMLVRQ